MLVTITGTIVQTIDDMIVVDVNGLGHGIRVPEGDRGKLKPDKTVTLYLYEHIREDSHELYGFVNTEDQWLFKQLVSVSGVGPKLALTVMSGVGGKQLRQAIVGGNSAVLESVSGVGKRTAERLVVELKNRLGEVLESPGVAGSSDTVFEALRQLGYPAVEARTAVAQVPAGIGSDEERLKHALKELSK